MKTRLALVAATAAAAAAVLTTGTAHATVLPLNGSKKCGSGALGQACVTPGSGGNFNAVYTNTTANPKYVDMNLFVSGGPAVGDGGAFTVNPGASRSYNFALGAGQSGACVTLKVYDRTGSLPPITAGPTC